MYKENADLSAANSVIAGLEKENAELRRLLDMNPKSYAVPCHAEIIIRDPVSWNELFTVDRGTYDGVAVGDLVLGMLPPDKGGESGIVEGYCQYLAFRHDRVRKVFIAGFADGHAENLLFDTTPSSCWDYLGKGYGETIR